MATLNLFLDAGLTTAVTLPLVFQQDSAGAVPPHVRQFYLGSNDTGLKFEALSDPGVDDVVISIVDSDSPPGQPASAITLALTEEDLGTNTPGASLSLGTQVLSEVANALPIWVQFDDSTGTVGTSTDINLATNALVASDV